MTRPTRHPPAPQAGDGTPTSTRIVLSGGRSDREEAVRLADRTADKPEITTVNLFVFSSGNNTILLLAVILSDPISVFF